MTDFSTGMTKVSEAMFATISAEVTAKAAEEYESKSFSFNKNKKRLRYGGVLVQY